MSIYYNPAINDLDIDVDVDNKVLKCIGYKSPAFLVCFVLMIIVVCFSAYLMNNIGFNLELLIAIIFSIVLTIVLYFMGNHCYCNASWALVIVLPVISIILFLLLPVYYNFNVYYYDKKSNGVTGHNLYNYNRLDADKNAISSDNLKALTPIFNKLNTTTLNKIKFAKSNS